VSALGLPPNVLGGRVPGVPDGQPHRAGPADRRVGRRPDHLEPGVLDDPHAHVQRLVDAVDVPELVVLADAFGVLVLHVDGDPVAPGVGVLVDDDLERGRNDRPVGDGPEGAGVGPDLEGRPVGPDADPDPAGRRDPLDVARLAAGRFDGRGVAHLQFERRRLAGGDAVIRELGREFGFALCVRDGDRRHRHDQHRHHQHRAQCATGVHTTALRLDAPTERSIRGSSGATVIRDSKLLTTMSAFITAFR
jgi:hypothetical protein